jgi:hypothetical protein
MRGYVSLKTGEEMKSSPVCGAKGRFPLFNRPHRVDFAGEIPKRERCWHHKRPVSWIIGLKSRSCVRALFKSGKTLGAASRGVAWPPPSAAPPPSESVPPRSANRPPGFGCDGASQEQIGASHALRRCLRTGDSAASTRRLHPYAKGGVHCPVVPRMA